MAERRVLALLGPCRVDGVGGGVGYEDLRGLDGVDVQTLHEDVSSRALTTALELVRDDLRRASRAANDAAWAPLGLHAPEPKFACCSWWPELVLPSVAISEPDAGWRAGAKRRAGGAEAEKDANAPAPSQRESAAPDSRWLDARCADSALAEMVACASRSTRARLDDDALDRMTNPAGAAARAAALLAGGEEKKTETETETRETDVAWITAGVDGGGGGGGEWPPEAVAAYGVMRAVKQAGGSATIIVLVADEGQNADGDDDEKDDEKDDENADAPPLLLEVAARVGATIRMMRHAPNEGGGRRAGTSDARNSRVGVFGDSRRWRGGLTVAAARETTLPSLCLRGANDDADDDAADVDAAAVPSARAALASTSEWSRRARTFPRAAGDATLLEIVRLETVPVDRRRDAPTLRLEWTPASSRETRAEAGEPEKKTDADRGDALRDDVFAALAAASRVVETRGETPAFLVRVPFSRAGTSANDSRGRLASVARRANDAKTSLARAPAPHADGPILLVRPRFRSARGSCAFVAEALASLPSLLRRAVAVAGASAACERGARALAAARGAKLREEPGAEYLVSGGTDKPATATPASVASTGRKRARAGEETRARAAAAAAAAKRRSSERRRDASAVEPVAADDGDLDDDASRERALALLASSRVRDLSEEATKRTRTVAAADVAADVAADATRDDDDDETSVEDADEDQPSNSDPTPGLHRVALNHSTRCRRPLGASAFARVLSALAAAQRRRDGVADARDAPPPFSPRAEEWAPEKLRLTATLLRAAADVAAGLDVVAEARRDAAGLSNREVRWRGPKSASPSGGESLPRNARSRSPSKSGASRECTRGSKDASERAEARPGGDASPKLLAPGALGGLDYAAAEAELRAKVQRERREKRERQRITMAPRHVPAARRDGNAVLAAATAASAERDDRRVSQKSQSRAGAPHAPTARDRANGSGGGTGTLSGHDGRDGGDGGREEFRGALRAGLEPEPSESAVGAGAAGPRAPRNRVCTKCHIELAPIPGVDMSLMKHCYACGGTLAPGM